MAADQSPKSWEPARLGLPVQPSWERKKRATGKCEGQKSIAELRPMSWRWRVNYVAGCRSQRSARSRLSWARGHVSRSGKPFEASP
jgi:hypothetical protein